MIALFCEEHLAEPLSAICHSALNFPVCRPLALEDIVFIIVVSAKTVFGTLSPFTDIESLELPVVFSGVCESTEAVELAIFKVAFVPQGATVDWMIVSAKTVGNTFEALTFVRDAA